MAGTTGIRQDLTGQKFGRLTVIEFSHRERHGFERTYIHWRCICECGNETVVRAGNLKQGTTKSCGCLHRERCGNMNRKRASNEKPTLRD